ncbi:hypothetical protein ACFVFQ_10815 [Streptomyces sp. NPDC057743]|uniref:hypothetical protein n=1 Tax=Streptomyces sp. NPDC057743 TaxID=3346236 RepID=UPI003687419E
MNASTNHYRLVAETPTVETYLRLRVASGLSVKTPEAARVGRDGPLPVIEVA